MVLISSRPSKRNPGPHASMPSQVLSRTENNTQSGFPETKLMTYQSCTMPRVSRHTQVVSGTPLVMSPKRPQTHKSSQMILTSTQIAGRATLGRSSSQLTGTSLQMSGAASKPGRTSETPRTSQSESLCHPMVHGTPLLMSKNALPRYEPSQTIPTRTNKCRISYQTASVSSHTAKTGSGCSKPAQVVEASVQESRMVTYPFAPHLARKLYPQDAKVPLRVVQSSQMILTSTSTPTAPGQRSSHSQVGLSKVTPRSQLSGQSLQMSTGTSQACNPPAMFLMKTRMPIPARPTQVPHQLDPSPRATSTTSTKIVTPSRMIGTTFQMTTLPLQFHRQKPVIVTSTRMLTTSHTNRHFQKAGKPLHMSS